MKRVGQPFSVSALLLTAACSQGQTGNTNGYLPMDMAKSAEVRTAVDHWHDCVVYGIGQVDDPKESSVTIAEAAMAGCARAETNLEDRLFDAMKGTDTQLEVRAQAHDEVNEFRQKMRAMAIRLVLTKHHEAKAPARS